MSEPHRAMDEHVDEHEELATRMNQVVVVKLSQRKSTDGKENGVSLVRITGIITTKNRPAHCILSLFR
jgi:hypothetical protein